MPHLVAAPDKFRGSATATEVARAIAEGAAALGWTVDELPLSDGGEGLLDALATPDSRFERTEVTGPDGRTVCAAWQLAGDRAVVEMAQASGLTLVGGASGNDPVDATTRGTGELIVAAARAVGSGGSGRGRARRVGDDRRRRRSARGGAGRRRARRRHLGRRVRRDDPVRRRRRTLRSSEGSRSRSRSHCSATDSSSLAERYLAEYGVDVREVPGSGAAGGLGGAILAMGGRVAFGVCARRASWSGSAPPSRARIWWSPAKVGSTGLLRGQGGRRGRRGLGALAVPVLAIVGQATDDAAATAQSEGCRPRRPLRAVRPASCDDGTPRRASRKWSARPALVQVDRLKGALAGRSSASVLLGSDVTTEVVLRGSRSNSGTGPQPWVASDSPPRVGMPERLSVERLPSRTAARARSPTGPTGPCGWVVARKRGTTHARQAPAGVHTAGCVHRHCRRGTAGSRGRTPDSHHSAAPSSLARADAAQLGAGWLAGQLTPGGYLLSATSPGQPDLVATANAVLALASAGLRAPASRALAYLEGHIDQYVVTGGADGPGQLALLDPRRARARRRSRPTFGGTDLVSRLLATQRTLGARRRALRCAGPDLRRRLPAGTLPGGARRPAGVVGTAPVHNAETWLTGQQCPDGGLDELRHREQPVQRKPRLLRGARHQFDRARGRRSRSAGRLVRHGCRLRRSASSSRRRTPTPGGASSPTHPVHPVRPTPTRRPS